MTKNADRTRDCDAPTRAGRMAKARQFIDAAHIIETLADEADDVADAYVTLCVHAGIAAADVICCARLGRHARGDDHRSAVELVEQADPDAAKHLRALLAMKTKAGYAAIPVSGSERTRAGEQHVRWSRSQSTPDRSRTIRSRREGGRLRSDCRPARRGQVG